MKQKSHSFCRYGLVKKIIHWLTCEIRNFGITDLLASAPNLSTARLVNIRRTPGIFSKLRKVWGFSFCWWLFLSSSWNTNEYQTVLITSTILSIFCWWCSRSRPPLYEDRATPYSLEKLFIIALQSGLLSKKVSNGDQDWGCFILFFCFLMISSSLGIFRGRLRFLKQDFMCRSWCRTRNKLFDVYFQYHLTC